jgi:large subunit ribosomal protein L9
MQTMEVILRDHVDHVGRRGEIVKVADGYARNYLLPRKLALRVTPGNRTHIERERGRFEEHEAEERQAAQAVAARLAGVSVVIRRKVGETEALYGSVTSADIAEFLTGLGFEVDKRRLQLRDPIKRLGEYSVPLKLHRDVIVPIPVRVLAEGAREAAPVPAPAAPAAPVPAAADAADAGAPAPAGE